MANSTLLLAAGSNAALVTFLIYTMAVFGLAWLSNRLLQSKSFLSEYFLGSRSLGVWAFALTFAATSASGGSFTGFPSRIYQHGWILGLWIASYMVVPICSMGLIGKRLNHVARLSGSITVPDVLRDRFNSPKFGLLAVSLIVFFMSFNLIAQFKAGSLILKTLLQDVAPFQNAAVGFQSFTGMDLQDPQYVLCLLTFGVAVIVYTTYGGFHAVVWTDVMQGVVMVIGVAIMLPLALSAVGGLSNATEKMKKMVPPVPADGRLEFETPPAEGDLKSAYAKLAGKWLWRPKAPADERLIKIVKRNVSNEDLAEELVKELADKYGDDLGKFWDELMVGIQQFTPNRFTMLAIIHQPDIDKVTSSEDFKAVEGVRLSRIKYQPYKFGHKKEGVYVSGPGPDRKSDVGFLALNLAFSYFFMWAISGSGQPSNMVRLMAFNTSTTLRRSIFTVAIYYSAIYFPLVIIFCIARVVMPGMDLQSDEIMPSIAVFLTAGANAPWLAGLLVAAPFAAVMSTVDSFLLMISSALVRDIYQRNFNPNASEKTLKRLSYLVTLLVGSAAVIGAMNPPDFLQDIIVYVGSGLAACFLAPGVFAIYWPRANLQGCMGGMLAGFGAHLSMYILGIFTNGSFFRPFRMFNFDPIIVGLVVSFAAVYLITLLSPPPPEKLVRKYFYKS